LVEEWNQNRQNRLGVNQFKLFSHWSRLGVRIGGGGWRLGFYKGRVYQKVPLQMPKNGKGEGWEVRKKEGTSKPFPTGGGDKKKFGAVAGLLLGRRKQKMKGIPRGWRKLKS